MDRLTAKRAQVALAVHELASGCGIEAMRVGQVMTPAPTCIPQEASALDLVRMFHTKEFRHLLVTDRSGKLTGVVSDRDVLRCFGPGRTPRKEILSAIPASQIMSTDVITIGPDYALPLAVKLLVEHGIGCLPVVAGDVVVGIITNTDLHVVLEGLLDARLPEPVELPF